MVVDMCAYINNRERENIQYIQTTTTTTDCNKNVAAFCLQYHCIIIFF